MFKVYYTDPVDQKCYSWDSPNLTDALYITEVFRKKGMSFVTMVSEDPNSVGKPGVDAILEGVLPDGHSYSWRKRR